MSELSLVAPLAGWVGPLDEAPDPVFAERMMGDGVLIDPTSAVLCAPCDGEVVSVHHTRHAVTIRAANGAEILMHIGLETVALKGEGFTAHVKDGQAVRCGRSADRLRSRPPGAERRQPGHPDHSRQQRQLRHHPSRRRGDRDWRFPDGDCAVRGDRGAVQVGGVGETAADGPPPRLAHICTRVPPPPSQPAPSGSPPRLLCTRPAARPTPRAWSR